MQGRSKMQTVQVVVLSDCLFFLQENNQKYTFFTPENKVSTLSGCSLSKYKEIVPLN